MKGFALLSAAAAVGLVSATPTNKEIPDAVKRASFPTVTAKGNGEI